MYTFRFACSKLLISSLKLDFTFQLAEVVLLEIIVAPEILESFSLIVSIQTQMIDAINSRNFSVSRNPTWAGMGEQQDMSWCKYSPSPKITNQFGSNG